MLKSNRIFWIQLVNNIDLGNSADLDERKNDIYLIEFCVTIDKENISEVSERNIKVKGFSAV